MMSTIIWAVGFFFFRYHLALIIFLNLKISDHILKYTAMIATMFCLVFSFQHVVWQLCGKQRTWYDIILWNYAYLCSFFKLFSSASSFLQEWEQYTIMKCYIFVLTNTLKTISVENTILIKIIINFNVWHNNVNSVSIEFVFIPLTKHSIENVFNLIVF